MKICFKAIKQDSANMAEQKGRKNPVHRVACFVINRALVSNEEDHFLSQKVMGEDLPIKSLLRKSENLSLEPQN